VASKKCPVCGVSVKIENLQRHVANRHPRADVDPEILVTKAERRQLERRSAPRPVITGKGLKVVLGVGVVVALVFVLVAANPFRSVGPGIGQYAPDFTLSTTTGGTVSLADYRGTPVLLEFMDVDCEYCQREARDALPYVYENYSASVRFLSVDVNFVGQPDTTDRINTFKATYGTPWAYMLDEAGRTTSAYGVRQTPWTFILDRNGVVVDVIEGSAPGGASDYAAALERALQV